MKQNDSDVTKKDLSYSIFISLYLRKTSIFHNLINKSAAKFLYTNLVLIF